MRYYVLVEKRSTSLAETSGAGAGAVVLYHGSRIRGLREILPAAITGATPTDGRAGMLDVVYVTTSIDHARSYAGRNGSVYVVDAPDARPYAEVWRDEKGRKASCARKKLAALKASDIWVASRATVVAELPGGVA
ncbi:MAG TPA: hypothetical protein PLJ11_04515 [Methanomassiliicoccales archaeon]|nr:hypothetical protein [Methanomassiliicoccales archaeon]